MKKQDPKNRILKIMENRGKMSNPQTIGIALVTSAPPNLKVQYKNIELDKDNIWINESLLDTYIREFQTEKSKMNLQGETALALAGVTGQATENPTGHKHPIQFQSQDYTAEGKIKFIDTLKKGDKLAILPTEDNQDFIILSKVVRL